MTTVVETAEKSKAGHRERLRQRFLAGEAVALTDEALLELLLCYVIPLKDVQPLAHKLIARFGGMAGVLAASLEALCQVEGVKSYSAALIKLAAEIRDRHVNEWAPPTTTEPSWTKQTSTLGLCPAFATDWSVAIPAESH